MNRHHYWPLEVRRETIFVILAVFTSTIDILLCVYKVEEAVLVSVASVHIFKLRVWPQHVSFHGKQNQAFILGDI